MPSRRRRFIGAGAPAPLSVPIPAPLEHTPRRPSRPGAVARSALALMLLAAVLLAPAPVVARDGGVTVMPADVSLLRKAPREIATSVIRVTNRTGAAATFQGELSLPAGWRPITPDFPFPVAAGETVLRLISFMVPAETPAGDYRVRYRVEQRNRPAVSGTASLSVRVLPVWKLQADLRSAPDLVIAGEAYEAVYNIINAGNAPLRVAYRGDSRRGYRISPAGGILDLDPGEAREVVLTVTTEDDGEPLRDTLTFIAEATAEGLASEASKSIEVVPRVSAGENPEISIDTVFTQSAGARLRDGEYSGGLQLSWSGAGAIDDTGERRLAFMLRGPDLIEETILGQREEFRVQYDGPNVDLALGDLTYALSPLTEQGRWGRGGLIRWRNAPFTVMAYHMREAFISTRYDDAVWLEDEQAWGADDSLRREDRWWGDETAVGLELDVAPSWRAGINLLHKHDTDGRNDVLSLRGLGELPGGLALELEAGAGSGDAGSGKGGFARLSRFGDELRYAVKFYHADPDFKGYYRDQCHVGMDFDYGPAGSPWSYRGYLRRDRYNLDRDPAYPATLDEDLLLGVSYRWPSEARLGLDLRHRERRDLRADSQFDADKTSVRLNAGGSVESLDLSVQGSVEIGRRRSRLDDERFNTVEYRLAGTWRPSRRLFVGGHLHYDGDATGSASRDTRITAGLGAQMLLSDRLSLSLDGQTDVLSERRRTLLNAQLRLERNNGHWIQLTARHDTGPYSDTNAMLSYSMPIKLPVGRRSDVATLRGRVFDANATRGFPNVVLKLGKLVAVTDGSGYFSFPSVKVGRYELAVVGGSLPAGMISLVELPVAVDLRRDSERPLDLPHIRGARIGGRVQLFEPPGTLLPSQTFRRGARGSPAAPDSDDLLPSRGLARVVVVVTDGETRYRRMTDAVGDFELLGLPPGAWRVSIETDGLPADATIEESSRDVDLEAGGSARVEFRVERKIRRMRMLEPLKLAEAAANPAAN
jgi:hypothetical protein